MNLKNIGHFVLAAGLLTVPVHAENLALVLANQRYENAPYLQVSGRAQEMVAALRQSGFRVITGFNQTGAQLQATALGFAKISEASGDPNKIIIVLSGHFAGNRDGKWMLGSDANRPNSFNIGANAISLSALTKIAARAPGQSVMMVGTTQSDFATGYDINAGIKNVKAPQGVNIVFGDFNQMPSILNNGYLNPGTSFGDVKNLLWGGVQMTGFTSRNSGLMPRTDDFGQDDGVTDEQLYWGVVSEMGTIAAFRHFIDRFPDGALAQEARRAVEAIKLDKTLRDQRREDALGLSRNARRGIQRNLALLGFNPRGIDGVFGRGSRAAIKTWQRQNSLKQTGFLNAHQMDEIQRQANRRSAEIEEEARQHRALLDQQDRDFWRQVGNNGSEQGLRAYIQRYPDGLFVDISSQRLLIIEARQRADTARVERDAWDNTREIDTVESYNSFIDRFPRSGFVKAAQTRMRALNQTHENRAQINQDKAEEARIAGSKIARLLIEKQLGSLRLDPGPIDGVFTSETRRAIRRFQQSQRIVVTGYLSQNTMVRLVVRNPAENTDK